jgi:hypothetical protein
MAQSTGSSWIKSCKAVKAVSVNVASSKSQNISYRTEVPNTSTYVIPCIASAFITLSATAMTKSHLLAPSQPCCVIR